MAKWYVAYTDRGPSGPCGQSVECTRHHNDLYIFNDEEAARAFIDKVNNGRIGRMLQNISGAWSEDMNNVFEKTNETT